MEHFPPTISLPLQVGARLGGEGGAGASGPAQGGAALLDYVAKSVKTLLAGGQGMALRGRLRSRLRPFGGPSEGLFERPFGGPSEGPCEGPVGKWFYIRRVPRSLCWRGGWGWVGMNAQS